MVSGGCVTMVLNYKHHKQTFKFAQISVPNKSLENVATIETNTYLFEFFYLFLAYNCVIYSQHFHSLLLIQAVLVDPDNDL